MAQRKYEVKKPRAKKPLTTVIAKQFAKRRLAPFLPDQVTTAPDEKERGSAIAFWQCFYLNDINDIMVKCIYKEKEERVHDE